MLFGPICWLAAQNFSGCISVDFETLPNQVPREGLVISDQYLAEFGVSFSLENGTSPRLAQVGFPTTAFASVFGEDTPAPGTDIGQFFLTDDGTLSGLQMSPLIITFAQPVDSFSTCVLDIDLGEWFVIEAFGENGERLLEDVIRDGDAGTGDGAATCWGFNFDGCEGSVYSVRFAGFRQTAGAFGLGMDNFSFCFTGVDLANAIAVETVDLTCTETSGTITMIPFTQTPLEYSLDGINYQSEPNFPGLPPGVYQVFVRDTSNCVANLTDITINDIVPLSIEEVRVQPTSCGNDNGQVEVYATPNELLFFSINNGPFVPDNRFDLLPAGDYTITILDQYECLYTVTADIAPSTAPQFTAITSVPDYCGAAEGSLVINASGGAEPLTYRLNNEQTTTDGSFSGLAGGTYGIVVADRLGCQIDSMVSVEVGALIELQGIAIQPPECREEDGAIRVRITGGNGPLIYQMDGVGFQAEGDFLGLGAGDYIIMVQDALGCELEVSANLPLPRCPLLIPNVFSPNDDSTHDFFQIYTASYYELEVLRYDIFDRWGELVWRRENFSNKSFREYWDGTFRGRPATQGVYVYLIEVRHPNGEVEQLSGDVTLIR
ncbi:MAG: gliding motility-associated C-terminal domain-containing protein [Bacteroidetes bacterium]|nr:MAG: gliding motility-associated C-terminal domain-containing protein [Bacteroidota bacterium]